jgi:hypothetical protein
VRPASEGLPLDPVPDPVAVERVTAARELHAEGIPMVLALEDVSGPGGTPAAVPASRPAVADTVREVGEALAGRIEEYRPLLRPQAAEDDEAAVHDVVVVVAFAHGPVQL